MANCKRCHMEFDWGQTNEGRWIPLEKVETDSDLRKTYVDNNGTLRADHRERCGGVPITVTRLKKPVAPEAEVKKEQKRTVKEKVFGTGKAQTA